MVLLGSGVAADGERIAFVSAVASYKI